MKTVKGFFLAVAGLLAAGAVGLLVQTRVFMTDGETLFSAGEYGIGLPGVGAALAAIVFLGFACGWTIVRRKREEPLSAGLVLNGAGFGLFPAAAVWKAFEAYTPLREGLEVPEGIPQLGFWTEAGCCQPCRMEWVLALALFFVLILWMMLRRESVPENGDVLGVSAALWGTVRLVTETFRSHRLFFPEVPYWVGYAAAGTMAVILCLWVIRARTLHRNEKYAIACLPVFAGAMAVIMLQRHGILQVNPAADLAILTACALLALKAVLCMGRVTRSPGLPEEPAAEPVTAPPPFGGPMPPMAPMG